jgi:signal peptidase I
MRSISRVLLVLAAVFVAAIGRADTVALPLTSVSLDTVLADAHKLASRHAGTQVLRIEGQSMLPFFGEGSVIVIKKIDASRLRPGMVVVYTNRFGETVAHRLVATTDGGWIARGFNNPAADSTVVNNTNLLGVVYATFHSNGRIAEPALASLALSTPSALAAPAR